MDVDDLPDSDIEPDMSSHVGLGNWLYSNPDQPDVSSHVGLGNWLYSNPDERLGSSYTEQPSDTYMSSYGRRSDSNFLIGNRNARLPEEITSCDQMCKILLETYNTSIIDHFSKELKQAFSEESKQDCMKEAEKCSLTKYVKGNKRKVLAALIRNKIDIEESYVEKYDFVGGPFNITYQWSNNYKKAVYILGEVHDKKVDCPVPTDSQPLKITNIENFLSYHFYKPLAFTDFLVEMPGHLVQNGYSYTGVTSSPDEFRLMILRRTFAPCIGPERNNPENASFCQNARMHFFDIRQGEVKGGRNLASLFQKEILDFVEANSTLKDNPTFWDITSEYQYDHYLFANKIFTLIQRWESFFDFFARFDNYAENTELNYKKFWYDQLRNFNIINKEIKVMHADVRPLLNIFIKNEMDNLLRFGYKKIAQYSKDILTTYRSLVPDTDPRFIKEKIIELISNLDKIIDLEILDFNSLISDAYLLACLFKTFQIEDYKKARPTDEPAEPHNVIIYAGNLHSHRYRKFLKYIGFRMVVSL